MQSTSALTAPLYAQRRGWSNVRFDKHVEDRHTASAASKWASLVIKGNETRKDWRTLVQHLSRKILSIHVPSRDCQAVQQLRRIQVFYLAGTRIVNLAERFDISASEICISVRRPGLHNPHSSWTKQCLCTHVLIPAPSTFTDPSILLCAMKFAPILAKTHLDAQSSTARACTNPHIPAYV